MKFLSSIKSIQEVLTTTDWVIFFLILAITFGAVIWGQRLKSSGENNNSEEVDYLDLLIMGRRLTLPLFVATLVATWYGGIFGVTELAFSSGIYNFITQGVFWYITYILFALFFVSKIYKYKAVTLPDLIKKLFGNKSSKLSALYYFLGLLPMAYAISLGIFLQFIFPQWNQNVLMAFGTILVLLYSSWGGLRAVVFSDLIQFGVMCTSVALVLFFSLQEFGGLSFLKTNLPETYFQPLGTHSIWETLAWGLIALSTLVDPNFYQRCFAANSLSTAKKGILISTLIWFMFDLCTTFGAMYARAVIPEANSQQAYLVYSLQLLPNGLRGFFLAGILATILSTLDSFLFLAGTIFTHDILPEGYKEKKIVHIGGVILIGILTITFSTFFKGDVKKVWMIMGGLWASCLLIPLTLGQFFPGKIKDSQFVFSSLFGLLGTLVWEVIEKKGFWLNLSSLYLGTLCTLLGLVLFSRLPNDRSQLKVD